MIIPQRHHQNNTLLECLVNCVQASLLKVIGAVLGLRNPICTELVRDGVVLVAIDGVHGMMNGLAVLSVKLLDLLELSMVGAILGDELCGDLNRVARVDGEMRTRSPELLLTKTVWLDVTTVLVTHALEAVWAIVAAIMSFAAGLLINIAGMHCVCS